MRRAPTNPSANNNDSADSESSTSGVSDGRPMTQSQSDLILQLQREKSGHHSLLTSMANLLESTIDTGFHDPRKFINEILQNANDANATSISFIIGEGYLHICYNGKPFKKHDVRRICDISTHDSVNKSSKVHNPKTIGYKGIGFKATFRVAEKVTIISKGWQFCFDKAKFPEEETPDGIYKKPWPIIPLIVNDEDISHIPNIQQNKVNIILEHFREPFNLEKIRKEIETLCQQHESIIFLDNIREVFFDIKDKRHLSLSKKDETIAEHGDLTIRVISSVNHAVRKEQTITRKWCLFIEKNVPVPDSAELIEAMKQMGSAECPAKIRDAKAVTVSLAGEIALENNLFIPRNENHLYCALPTGVESGLHFLANANFLLTQNRADILNNPWNAFLLGEIGRLQFKWLARLTGTPLRMSMLELIPDHSAVLNNYPSIATAYEIGAQRGRREYAFIPSIDGKLLYLHDAIVDETKFFIGRLWVKDKTLLLPSEDWRIVDPEFAKKNQKNLVSFVSAGLGFYPTDMLLTRVSDYAKQARENPENLTSIVQYFLEHSQRQSIDRAVLSTLKIFITIENEFACAAECFLLAAETDQNSAWLIQQFSLKIIQPFYKCPSLLPGFQTHFIIPELTTINFVKHYIFRLIKDKQITRENTFFLLRQVFYAYYNDNNAFTHEDFEVLSQFPVICGTNPQPIEISRCFLGIDPSFPVEATIAQDYFRSEINNPDFMAVWHTLLKKMKINLTVKLDSYSPLPYNDAIRITSIRYNFVQSYAGQVVRAKLGTASGTKAHFDPFARSFNATLVWFEHFVYFNSIAQILDNPLQNQAYTQLLWLAIVKNWDYFQTPCRYYYRMTGEVKKIDLEEHFLLFCLKNYELTRVYGNNTLAKTGALIYLPSLIDLVRGVLPTPDLPVSLDENQAITLGFRTSPTLDECLQLLDIELLQSAPSLNKLKKIYRLILRKNDKMTANAMAIWKSKTRLITLDKSPQQVNTVGIYDGEGCAPEPKNRWLNGCGLDKTELIQLAELLDLPRFSQEQNTHLPSFSEKSDELGETLKNSVLDCLPYLIWLETQQRDETPQQILSEKLALLWELKFKRTDSPIIIGKKQANVIIDGSYLIFYTYARLRNIQQDCYQDLALKLGKHLGLLGSTIDEFKDILNAESKDGYVRKNCSSADQTLITKLREQVILRKKLEGNQKAISEPMLSTGNLGDETTEQAPPSYTSISSSSTTSTAVTHFPSPHTPEQTVPIVGGSGSRIKKRLFSENETTLESSAKKREKGWRGEKTVFYKILKHYLEKYGLLEKVKKDKEEVIYATHGQNKNGENVSLRIIWHEPNPQQSAMGKCDITIEKTTNGNTIKKYIEVKSTGHRDQERALSRLSRNEWQLAAKNPSNTTLFFVSDVDKQPKVRKFKNFAGMLSQVLRNNEIIFDETQTVCPLGYIDLDGITFYITPSKCPEDSIYDYEDYLSDNPSDEGSDNEIGEDAFETDDLLGLSSHK